MSDMKEIQEAVRQAIEQAAFHRDESPRASPSLTSMPICQTIHISLYQRVSIGLRPASIRVYPKYQC